MKLFNPPTIPVEAYDSSPSIFLAGSIEMDRAANWQDAIIADLADDDITIFNPRRKDWDNNIAQSLSDPRFRTQVEWELEMLRCCSTIIMYLQPGTISPISLLELGLFADHRRIVVCCPEGFHRKGNVDFISEVFSLITVDTLEELTPLIKLMIKEGNI